MGMSMGMVHGAWGMGVGMGMGMGMGVGVGVGVGMGMHVHALAHLLSHLRLHAAVLSYCASRCHLAIPTQVVESIFKLQDGREAGVAADMRNALIDQLA